MTKLQKFKLAGTILGVLLASVWAGAYLSFILLAPLTIAAIAFAAVVIGALAGNVFGELICNLIWPNAAMAEFASAILIEGYYPKTAPGNPYVPKTPGRDYPMLSPVPSSDSFNNVRLTPSPTPTK